MFQVEVWKQHIVCFIVQRYVGWHWTTRSSAMMSWLWSCKCVYPVVLGASTNAVAAHTEEQSSQLETEEPVSIQFMEGVVATFDTGQTAHINSCQQILVL